MMRLLVMGATLALLACSELRGPGSLLMPDAGLDDDLPDASTTGAGGESTAGVSGAGGASTAGVSGAGGAPTAGTSGAGGKGDKPTSAVRVLSVEPADGATGVAAEAQIVLQFSARMNRLSVQRAWDSSDVATADVNWSWQETAQGDRLTITPKTPLTYASNTARTYTFAISAQALDAADNPMVPFTSSFSVLRRLVQDVQWDLQASGSVGYLANSSLDHLSPGELSLGFYSVARGFLTFDLAALFKAARAIESAQLRLYQREDNYCNPFDAAGGCYQGTVDVASIQYPAFLAALRSVSTPSDRIGTISNSWKPEWKSLNVTAAVAEDFKMHAARGNRAQFIVFFSRAKAEEVWLYFSNLPTDPGGAPTLRVEYLAP